MATIPIIPPASIKRLVKEYTLIALGLFLYSFAWISIILPAKVVGGGATGASLLVYYATGGENGGVPIGISVFLINAVLLLIAMMIIDIKFGAKTIYAVLVLSIAMGFMQKVIPADLLGLSQDRLLSAILGGAVSGIGISLCFMQGGSTGGTDIIAMIINKYRNISYGRIILYCDFVIIGGSYFINFDISMVIYSYIVTVVATYMLDSILAGNRQSSQLFIISKNSELIAQRISTEMVRGVTIFNGKGWYTQEPKEIVMVVCRKNETSNLFRIIKECDPAAFITVGSVMGVYGLGFESLKK